MFNRSLKRVARSITNKNHWLTVFKCFYICHTPMQYLRRYVLGLGSYPWSMKIRTPTGTQEVVFERFEDLFTLNEIFIWEIYGNHHSEGVFIDIGGNVGMASLYFLTRNAKTRGVLVEPLADNLSRARDSMIGFGDRIEIIAAAVSFEDGELEIGVEPTGRYSGLDCLETGAKQTFKAIGINTLIEHTHKKLGRVATVKIDCEGAEQLFMPVITDENLSKVARFVIESFPIKDKNLIEAKFVMRKIFSDGIAGVFEYRHD